MNLRVTSMRPCWVYLPVLVALAAITCAFWAPFGWRVSGTFEEWFVVVRADSLGVLSQLYVHPSNRPLFQAPMVVAHWLTPGSFLGMNILQALLIFGASAALFWLVANLPPANRAVAFVAAALMLVYPADDATYTLRATNIHAGVFFLLISLCLLTASIRKATWQRIIAMVVMQVLSLAIYDGGFLIMLCGPAMVLCMRRAFTRRTALLSLAWWAAPTFFAFALWRVVRDPDAYQGALIRSSGLGHDYSHDFYVFSQSIGRALTRNFWSGWTQATTVPPLDDPYLKIAIALALFVFAPLAWVLSGRGQKSYAATKDSRYWILAGTGERSPCLDSRCFCRPLGGIRTGAYSFTRQSAHRLQWPLHAGSRRRSFDPRLDRSLSLYPGYYLRWAASMLSVNMASISPRRNASKPFWRASSAPHQKSRHP